jgi:alpha(1,3/1,4) fucosyltransferase
MKKILVQASSPNLANNSMFKKDVNNLNVAAIEMKRKLFDMGYELTTADDHDLTDCEGILFFNADSLVLPPAFKKRLFTMRQKLLGRKLAPSYPTRDLYSEAISAGLRDKLVLVLWEARAVLPSNFDPKIWDKFDHILTWDDDLLKNAKFTRFYIPMEGNKPVEKAVPFREKKLLVNISFNKYSFYKNELYSARRKSIQYFTRYYPNDFDLFGYRWNQPVTSWQRIFPFLVRKYSSYRGSTEHKLETMSRYKFNIAYENISDAKGYVADRIFCAFQSKSVPIYWGATNIEEYVDANAFIDRRNFKSNAELASFLVKMTEKEYDGYLEAAARYMRSEKFVKFLPENYARQFIEVLNLKNLNNPPK